MKLRAFDRKILIAIQRSLPPTVEESLLQSEPGNYQRLLSHEKLVETFGEWRRPQVDESVHALIKFKQIAEVFLEQSPQEPVPSESDIRPGAVVDDPKQPRAGYYGYQITNSGRQSLLASRYRPMFVLESAIASLVPSRKAEFVKLCVVLLTGIVLGAIGGVYVASKLTSENTTITNNQ